MKMGETMKVLSKNNIKILTTDIDGIIFMWEKSFRNFMYDKHKVFIDDSNEEVVKKLSKNYNMDIDEALNYVYNFNKSNYFKNLEPYKDAIFYIGKLKKLLDLRIVGISSAGTDETILKNRWKNLKKHFDNVFDTVHHCNLKDSKKDLLYNYTDSLCWVEDSKKNAELGGSIGIPSFLLRTMSATDDLKYSKNVKSWQEIYEYLRKDK